MNLLLALLAILSTDDGDPPRSLAPELRVERVAGEPDLVTPVAVSVDARGRVFVVESHTHFRPDGYSGPERDRILVFEDGRRSVFHQGEHHTMSLACCADGSLLVATRREVFRLRDEDGDGLADQRIILATLQTKGSYPHNGLCGFALHENGQVYFGFGENLGEPYELIGTDGTVLSGGGEGGNVYRFGPDGSGLARVATGFWNPFHMCFAANGSLFVVDNDPDSRPPCRLLHIVEGGDYGYRYRNGRAGQHPFTAWDGELPGTLPMVAGTGEAPSAIVEMRGEQLPPRLHGQLLVTSWGHHRLEAYSLVPTGASYRAERSILVQGGVDFRPVGLAVAPDGTVYFSDWVDESYNLHGKGRLWRLRSVKENPVSAPWTPAPPSEDVVRARELRLPAETVPADELASTLELLKSDDPFLRQAAREWLREHPAVWRGLDLHAADDRVVLGLLLCWLDLKETGQEILGRSLRAGADPRLKYAAVQRIGEGRLVVYQPLVEALLEESDTPRELVAASLAALDLLAGGAPGRADKTAGAVFLQEAVRGGNPPPALLIHALRGLPPDDSVLAAAELERWIATEPEQDGNLAREAVRTLRAGTTPAKRVLLARIARSNDYTPEVRAEAVMGLDPFLAEHRELLLDLAAGSSSKAERKIVIVQEEALRTLRDVELSAPERERLAAVAPVRVAARELLAALLGSSERLSPPNPELDSWLAELEGAADAAAGERLFRHPRGPGCTRCHSVHGRGASIGPDLSLIARSRDRRQLLESVLLPSRDIAPRYASWAVKTRDGQILELQRLGETVKGKEIFADSEGRRLELDPSEIVARRETGTSIMPTGLITCLQRQEVRDLLAFLETLR